MLLGVGATVAAGIWPLNASATIARGIPLDVLARRSEHILVGTALEATCRFEYIGGKRRIVTDTRFAVEAPLAKAEPGESEVLVRTLGGVIGDLGELVHGEAELSLGERSVLFLRLRPDAIHQPTGMAQGHYPLYADAERVERLRPSPRLPELIHPERSAVRRLRGLDIEGARRLIQEALAR